MLETQLVDKKSLPVSFDTEYEYIKFNNMQEREDIAKQWMSKIEKAEKAADEWLSDAEYTLQVYYNDTANDGSVFYNILHSNLNYIKPAVHPSPPKPSVDQLPTDDEHKDKINRSVAQMVEDIIKRETDNGKLDSPLSDVITNAVIPGRGVFRVYFTSREKKLSQGNYASPEDEIHYESIPYDKIIYGPCTTPEKTPWIIFIHEITRDEMNMYLDNDIELSDMAEPSAYYNKDDKEEYDHRYLRKMNDESFLVFEVWDGVNKEVIWIANTQDGPIAVAKYDDPHQLRTFFPVSRPVSYLTDIRTSQPFCHYNIYKDMHLILQIMQARKMEISEKVYPRYLDFVGSESSIVKDWVDGRVNEKEASVFSDPRLFAKIKDIVGPNLDISKLFIPFPIKDCAETIAILDQCIAIVVEQIREVSGIGDIQRGETNPQEAYKATKLKAYLSNTRLHNLQRSIQSAIRDVYQISGELILNSYSLEDLKLKSGRTFETDDPVAQQDNQDIQEVFLTAKQDKDSFFRFDIESTSLKEMNMEENIAKATQLDTIVKNIVAVGETYGEDPNTALSLIQMEQSKADLLDLPSNQAQAFHDAITKLTSKLEDTIKAQNENPNYDIEQAQQSAEISRIIDKEFDLKEAQAAKTRAEAQNMQLQLQAEQAKTELESKKAQIDLDKIALDKAKEDNRHSEEMAKIANEEMFKVWEDNRKDRELDQKDRELDIIKDKNEKENKIETMKAKEEIKQNKMDDNKKNIITDVTVGEKQ